MRKLHIKRNGQWLPVFCRNGGRVVTCESEPHKALPPKAIWAEDDLAYFRAKFANEEFELRFVVPKD